MISRARVRGERKRQTHLNVTPAGAVDETGLGITNRDSSGRDTRNASSQRSYAAGVVFEPCQQFSSLSRVTTVQLVYTSSAVPGNFSFFFFLTSPAVKYDI